jgi:hypothetical protein
MNKSDTTNQRTLTAIEAFNDDELWKSVKAGRTLVRWRIGHREQEISEILNDGLHLIAYLPLYESKNGVLSIYKTITRSIKNGAKLKIYDTRS